MSVASQQRLHIGTVGFSKFLCCWAGFHGHFGMEQRFNVKS
jgi:hypothetical protein